MSQLMQQNVLLAPLTTIGLGGAAKYYARGSSVEEIKEALTFAQHHDLAVQVMAGGSNTVFPEAGFSGLVLKVELAGVELDEDGTVVAAAGESWDRLVQQAIKLGLAGLENLSGIPGSVGATPIQNVGAYGQEVAQTITSLKAIDRATLKEVVFSNDDCQFVYRSSRFKGNDRDRFIITAVTYQLRPQGEATLVYPQLREALNDGQALANLAPGQVQLTVVREAVLLLRQAKSMVIDEADPHSRSCGSFFMNPQLTAAELEQLTRRHHEAGGQGSVPTFVDSDDGAARVPAAWLIEQSGFAKGDRRDKVGISPNHALALVNYGGTTKALLALAGEIIAVVKKRFDIELIIEPVVVD